jgi:hypothetical protein
VAALLALLLVAAGKNDPPPVDKNATPTPIGDKNDPPPDFERPTVKNYLVVVGPWVVRNAR